MKPLDAKNLCIDLIRADTEEQVIDILKRQGFWDDPSVWRFYGDRPRNWATVGGQQSRPDQALIEKLTNAIDTKLIAAARIANRMEGPHAPTSIFKARDMFFGEQMKDMETLSKSITVAATGAATGRRQRPSLTIVDDGEGVTPADMPKTILSLHEGNKDMISFVQGKFNMGGSGVLEFCGGDRNVEVVLSRRNPELLPANAGAEDRNWSYTVIRREDPGGESPRSSRFTYLAPGPPDADSKRGLLTFDSLTMPIFPEKNRAYAREASWGTLFKLYEYGTRAVTNMMLEDGLMMKLRLLLPEPALPIRFHECRDYKGDPNRSFDTPMAGLIFTLDADRKSPKRKSVEWFDRFDIDIDGQKFTVRIYLFRKPEIGKTEKREKNPAENYRRDEGVVFTYNGQAQAVYSKDFFRRKRVKQDYLWNSLLVFVDCTAIGVRPHEKLFMPNRESLRDGPLKRQLERELEDKLRDHKELEQIAIARRKGELSESPEVSETFEKFVEEMVRKHPLLEQILGPGFRIANPFKPQLVEAGEKPFESKRFPTKFHFRGPQAGKELERDAHLNSQVRVQFETDAENDYFRRDEEPGEFKLLQLIDGNLTPAKNWRTPGLFNGSATLTISALPEEAKIGDTLIYEAQIMDPSRIEPFRNRFTLTIRAERVAPGPPSPKPPKPKPQPTDQEGKDKPNDSQLNVPNPQEIHEPAWPTQDPPFDRFTAMRIKRQPGAPENSEIYDYFINMDNVFLVQATKVQPKRAQEYRDRFKFGMTLISLALLRHDLELKKRDRPVDEDEDEEEDESRVKRQDVHERVGEVTSALAPFLLPLVDSLSEITGTIESPSATAGEAA